MTPGKVLFAGAAFSASLFLLSVPAFAAPLANCKEPKAGTKDAPIFSPPRAAVVVGTGRLQFYSAPRVRCPISGVFVVPKDHLVVYAQTDDGWSSVMHINPRTGDDVSGWVRSVRLKDAGTVGPDHDDFGSNRSKVMNVIDSDILERDAGGKPLHAFPHPAPEQ